MKGAEIRWNWQIAAPWSSDQFWSSGLDAVCLPSHWNSRLVFGEEKGGGRGGGGCWAESKGWDLLFQSEKELMVRPSQLGIWNPQGAPGPACTMATPPLPSPQCVFLPQSATNNSRWGSGICCSAAAIQAVWMGQDSIGSFTWTLLFTFCFRGPPCLIDSNSTRHLKINKLTKLTFPAQTVHFKILSFK